MVGTIRVRSRVSSNCREQRKLPPKTFCRSALPSLYTQSWFCQSRFGPVSQKTRGLPDEESLVYFVMSSNILTRVPAVHSSRFKLQGLLFENSFVVSLPGGTQTFQVHCLSNRLLRGYELGNLDTYLVVIAYTAIDHQIIDVVERRPLMRCRFQHNLVVQEVVVD